MSDLDYFIRLANDSCNEALVKLKGPLEILTNIDQLYLEFFQATGDMKPSTAAILLVNSHASLRAAIRLALSGQLLPVFMALRGSIESSLYANAMIVEPELYKVWLNRNKDKACKDKCRAAFSINKMFDYLEQDHNKEYADGIRDIYGSTIDFGAHPNSQSIIRSVYIKELDDGNNAVEFAYIHGPGSFELKQSLVACVEVGVAVFYVVLICFDEHPNLTDLNDRILKLHDQIPSFIESLGLAA